MNFKFVFISLCFFWSLNLSAKPLFVVTTIPEFAWLAEEVGGDQVETKSFLKGNEDPHYIDAVPQYILDASRADLLCFVGLELEVGWLPRVIEASGNRKIQGAQDEVCDLSREVEIMGEIESPVDRSHGHIHASGNPHYWLSARQLARVSFGLARHLSRLRPEYSSEFQERAKELAKRLENLASQERETFKNFKDVKLIQYHAEFDYLLKEWGLQTVAYTIEEKPGVKPSARALSEVAQAARRDQVALALASHISPQRLLNRFSELSSVSVLAVPTMSYEKSFWEFYEGLSQKIRTTLEKRASSSRVESLPVSN